MRLRLRTTALVALGPLSVAGARLAAQAPKCPEPDSTAPWAQVSRAFRDGPGAHWSNDSLRHVLLALVERDQAARADFGSRAADSGYASRLIALDSTLADEVQSILDRFGLPTRSMVGAAGARAVMLIVQHNGRLQERVLAMARAAPPGEVFSESLGMLEDRVLTVRGEWQIYGTQFAMMPDGRFKFAPTVDVGTLDQRRASVGMPPMSLYVCWMEAAGMRLDRTSIP